MQTPRRMKICDVGVMGRLARPHAYPRGTAKGHGAVMVSEESPMISNMLFQVRHMRKGVHMEVLVIGQDENDIRLFASIERPLDIASGCRCETQQRQA